MFLLSSSIVSNFDFPYKICEFRTQTPKSSPTSCLRLLKKQNDLKLPFSVFFSVATFPEYRNIGEFGAKNDEAANTIQLLVAIKGHFSGLLFFRTSRKRREIPRRQLDK